MIAVSSHSSFFAFSANERTEEKDSRSSSHTSTTLRRLVVDSMEAFAVSPLEMERTPRITLEAPSVTM